MNILIPIIDAVKDKNLYQYKYLAQFGYRFIVLTTDSTGHSQNLVASVPNIELHVCPEQRRIVWFITTVIHILRTRRIEIVEIYPYSILNLILAAIVKIARIPLILIARGDEYWYMNGLMPVHRRMAFRLTYLLGDVVIYKELYMQDLLLRFGKTKTFLLENAVDISPTVHLHSPDQCHFLFLNTLKFFRHPEIPLKAFLRICEELHLNSQSPVRLSIVGLPKKLSDDSVGAKNGVELASIIKDRDVPVELHPWTDDPAKWLNSADVFLLPADVVFLNYSLLEAMSRGIPPIVQETEGSELIVTHGVDGFILPPDESIWYQHMLRLVTDATLRQQLGEAARKKVEQRFSLPAYLKRYNEIYQSTIRTG